MNPNDYISSGIAESYVLGLADESERAEFEEMCRKYAEVKAARTSFELGLQKYALENAVPVPSGVKQSIFEELGLMDTGYITPVIPISTPTHASFQDSSSSKSFTRLKYIAAASVILLVASALLNFYFFGQYKDYSNRYSDLLASQQQVVTNNVIMQTKLQTYEEEMALMNDTNMAIIRMPGSNVASSPAPSSLATIYWQKQSKDVYLHVNNMPHPIAGKQYQLWAMVNGKPVDAGVFDVGEDLHVILKMKNIPSAQAFAVTLENKGGSPVPTMEQLYILGKV